MNIIWNLIRIYGYTIDKKRISCWTGQSSCITQCYCQNIQIGIGCTTGDRNGYVIGGIEHTAQIGGDEQAVEIEK